MTNNLVLLIISLSILFTLSAQDVFADEAAQSKKLLAFQNWADTHNITLQGTNKKTNDLYYVV